jgi:hypothetical protein
MLFSLGLRGVVFPEGFSLRENNIARVNNYDVHRKCRQKSFYYTETLCTIMLDAINTYLCVFILCFHKLPKFLTSSQDCNSGMQKRIHFRTDMEHNICRPVNNSDVSLGYQFCKNITFILYIIYIIIPH